MLGLEAKTGHSTSTNKSLKMPSVTHACLHPPLRRSIFAMSFPMWYQNRTRGPSKLELKKEKGDSGSPGLKVRFLKTLRTKRNILVLAARRALWPPWLFGGMLAEGVTYLLQCPIGDPSLWAWHHLPQSPFFQEKLGSYSRGDCVPLSGSPWPFILLALVHYLDIIVLHQDGGRKLLLPHHHGHTSPEVSDQRLGIVDSEWVRWLAIGWASVSEKT